MDAKPAACRSSLAAMAAGLWLCAFAWGGEQAALEGLYRGSGKEPPTIQFVREAKDGALSGVLIDAKDDWRRKQLQQAVIQLQPAGEREFRGRCSAYYVQFSKDMGDWLEVAKAELLDGGDLRCQVKIPDGGSVDMILHRIVPRDALVTGEGQPPAKGGEPGPLPEPDDGDITGLWRITGTGALTRYERQGDRYTEYVVKLAPGSEEFGFHVGEEAVHLTRKGRNTYFGEIKVNTEGGRSSWWEPIEMTVQKNSLTFVRHKTNGQMEKGTGVRLRTLDGN